VSEAELTLMRPIDELRLEHTFAGSRMLRDFLRLRGIQAGRRQVGTLMRMGIQCYRSIAEFVSAKGDGEVMADGECSGETIRFGAQKAGTWRGFGLAQR
jgi:hypothetical protein